MNYEFVHGNDNHELDEKNKEKPLTFDIIKELDSKDFAERFHDVEFFDVIVKNNANNEKFTSVYNDISENYEMDEIIKGFKFNLIDKDSYYTQKSSQYLFKAD